MTVCLALYSFEDEDSSMITEHQNSITEIQQRMSTVENKLSDLENEQKKLDVVSHKLSILTQDCIQHKEYVETFMKNSHNKFNNHQRNIADIQQALLKSSDTVENIKDTIEILKVELREYKKKNHLAVNKIKEELNSNNQETDIIKTKLEIQRSIIEKLENDIKHLENRLNQSFTSYHTTTREITNNQKQIMQDNDKILFFSKIINRVVFVQSVLITLPIVYGICRGCSALFQKYFNSYFTQKSTNSWPKKIVKVAGSIVGIFTSIAIVNRAIYQGMLSFDFKEWFSKAETQNTLIPKIH